MRYSQKTMEALTAELNAINTLWESYKQRRKTMSVPEPLSIDQINQKVNSYISEQGIRKPSLTKTMLIIREMLLQRMQSDPGLNSAVKQYIAANYDKLKKKPIPYSFLDTSSHFPSNIDTNQTAWRWMAKYADFIEKSTSSVTVNEILINIVTLLKDPAFKDSPQNKQQLAEHLVQQISILQRANYERETALGEDRPSCLLGSSPILVLVYESHPAFQKKLTAHEMVKKKTQVLLAKIAADEMQAIMNSAQTNAAKKTAMLNVCEILSSVGLHTLQKRATPEQIFTTTNGNNIGQKLLRQRKIIRDKYYPNVESLCNAVTLELEMPLKAVDRMYISVLWSAIVNEEVRHLIYRHYERLVDQLPKASQYLLATQAALSSYHNLSRPSSLLPAFRSHITAVHNQFATRLTDYLDELNTQEFAGKIKRPQLQSVIAETTREINSVQSNSLQSFLIHKLTAASVGNAVNKRSAQIATQEHQTQGRKRPRLA